MEGVAGLPPHDYWGLGHDTERGKNTGCQKDFMDGIIQRSQGRVKTVILTHKYTRPTVYDHVMIVPKHGLYM